MANILTGRKKVIIPISADEFYKDVVGMLKKHLPTAIQTHNENVRDIEKLEKQYLGNQDILAEKKRYDDSPINNLVVENHVHKVVNFKVGFMYGNPIEYSLSVTPLRPRCLIVTALYIWALLIGFCVCCT